VEQDHKFWDAYSQKLLSDPRFRMDADAILNFGKLAFWHSDLYGYRGMLDEQEHWLRLALTLCPQLGDAVNGLAQLLVREKRFDEAVAVVQQAMVDDPRNDFYTGLLKNVSEARVFGERERELRDDLTKAPYDVDLNLELARVLQDEGKFDEVNERLRIAAGLTNWTHDATAAVIQYYVNDVNNLEAAIAFLEARAQIDTTSGELLYSLAALEAQAGHADPAFQYLAKSVMLGGTNAIDSAQIDPRFAPYHSDPRFAAIINSGGTNINAMMSGTNVTAASTNQTAVVPPQTPPAAAPVKKHVKKHHQD
jgi:tetratricopeptide (TPR) repeat protein